MRYLTDTCRRCATPYQLRLYDAFYYRSGDPLSGIAFRPYAAPLSIRRSSGDMDLHPFIARALRVAIDPVAEIAQHREQF